MADTVSLDLELVNKVSQPAKAAADALRKVDEQATRAQAALGRAAEKQATATRRLGLMQVEAQRMDRARSDRAVSAAQKQSDAVAKQMAKAKDLVSFHKQSEAVEQRLHKLRSDPGGYVKMLRAQRELKEQQAALRKQSLGFGGAFKEAFGFDRFTKAAFWGDLAAEGVMKIGEGFIEGAKMAVEIVYDGIKDAFKAGSEYEQTKLSYGLLFGNKKLGGEALEDISRFSGKTRYDDDEIAKMMRPLFNAGFRGTGARSAFAAAGDLNAAGLGETSDFIEQLTKIKLKGGVGAKQLVGMGVNVPEFSKSLAAALHTGTKSAMERAKNGTVDPQMLLNLIYEGIEKRQGGKLGTGTEQMGATMGARWHKLTMLPEDFLKRVADSPQWGELSGKLGEMLEAMDPEGERGKKIMGALMDSFGRVADLIGKELTPQRLNDLTDGILGVIKAAEVMAKAFFWVADKITDFFGDFGRADTSAKAREKLGGIGGVSDMWSKVRESQGVGWWEAQMLDQSKVDELLDRAAKQGVITEDQSADIHTSFYGRERDRGEGGAGSATVDQRGLQINVYPQPGEDPKDAGKRVGDGFNASTVRHLERAMQERGGD